MRRALALLLVFVAAVAGAQESPSAWSSTAGGVVYSSAGGTKLSGPGVAGDCLKSSGAGAPTWGACGGGGGGPTKLRVAADVSSTSLTFSDVTGLSVSVTSGTAYHFTCFLVLTSAINTTAPQLSVNGPASPTALDYSVSQATSATAWHNSAQTAYDTVTNAATGPGAVLLPARVHGSIIPSANGTLAIRLRSEVSGSAATVKRGSFCLVH